MPKKRARANIDRSLPVTLIRPLIRCRDINRKNTDVSLTETCLRSFKQNAKHVSDNKTFILNALTGRCVFTTGSLFVFRPHWMQKARNLGAETLASVSFMNVRIKIETEPWK